MLIDILSYYKHYLNAFYNFKILNFILVPNIFEKGKIVTIMIWLWRAWPHFIPHLTIVETTLFLTVYCWLHRSLLSKQISLHFYWCSHERIHLHHSHFSMEWIQKQKCYLRTTLLLLFKLVSWTTEGSFCISQSSLLLLCN